MLARDRSASIDCFSIAIFCFFALALSLGLGLGAFLGETSFKIAFAFTFKVEAVACFLLGAIWYSCNAFAFNLQLLSNVSVLTRETGVFQGQNRLMGAPPFFLFFMGIIITIYLQMLF